MEMTTPREAARANRDQVQFRAGNIVGDTRIDVRFDRQLRAAEVADMLAQQMMLSMNVPAYALRSERLGRYLDDEVAIGDQVEDGEDVTVTPKTHLGGACRSR